MVEILNLYNQSCEILASYIKQKQNKKLYVLSYFQNLSRKVIIFYFHSAFKHLSKYDKCFNENKNIRKEFNLNRTSF